MDQDYFNCPVTIRQSARVTTFVVFPLLPHITYPGIYKSSLPTDTKASQNSQQDIKVVTRETVPYLSRGVSSAQSGNCLKSEDPQNGPFAYSETLTEVPRVPPSELCPQTEEERK